MRSLAILLVSIVGAAALAGCAQTPPATDDSTSAVSVGESCDRAALPTAGASPVDAGGTVTLLTHDSFNMADELVAAFRNQTGHTLEVVKLGDAGEALNKAILQKDAPVGDVFFGVDDTLIHRAAQNGLFSPYASPAIVGVEDRFVTPFCAGDEMLATPVSYGYVNLNHDPAWFDEHGVALPDELADLATAEYAPLTVVMNPYTSSPGMAFLLATVDTFGTEGDFTYEDFWRGFSENGGKVTSGWEEAYGAWFTQGWDTAGAMDRPIVVSYSTSPAFNPMMGYAENATSANLDLAGSAWIQIEAAGVLANADNPEGAQAFIDFLLSREFQDAVATQFVTYPVRPDAETPAEYALYAQEPAQPARIPAATIDANQDAWLRGWSDATGQA